jgi:hypothetical protein
MTTKQLMTRQAHWAKALIDYHFIIIYYLEKKNKKADTLICHNNKIAL